MHFSSFRFVWGRVGGLFPTKIHDDLGPDLGLIFSISIEIIEVVVDIEGYRFSRILLKSERDPKMSGG